MPNSQNIKYIRFFDSLTIFMDGFEILAFQEDNSSEWDQFCASAYNSTPLHSRHYLSYHGNRFKDVSVFLLQYGRVVGIFPAAVSLNEPDLVVSHPGITYGGIVHHGKLIGSRMIEALEHLCDYYVRHGYRRLQYKVLPHIYATAPAQDDLYALFRIGAKRIRCDLSCAIDLQRRLASSDRRRRGLKKANKFVALSSDPLMLESLWNVLADNLFRKYGTHPIHSFEEISLLSTRFPDYLRIRCAHINGRVEAGVVLFITQKVWHTQYIAASELGYETSALDAVLDGAIKEATVAGAAYFDFGTSNEDHGRVLNEGLYRFKTEFGAGGVAHEYYEVMFSTLAGVSCTYQ